MKVQRSLPGSGIHVVIRLFAQFGAPEYHVVVGEPDPAFCRFKSLAINLEIGRSRTLGTPAKVNESDERTLAPPADAVLKSRPSKHPWAVSWLHSVNHRRRRKGVT
jgi:hypothetical protein